MATSNIVGQEALFPGKKIWRLRIRTVISNFCHKSLYTAELFITVDNLLEVGNALYIAYPYYSLPLHEIACTKR